VTVPTSRSDCFCLFIVMALSLSAPSHGREPKVSFFDVDSWTAFSTALAERKPSTAKAFIGREILVIGSRGKSKPEGLELNVDDARERNWTVLVIRPVNNRRVRKEIEKVEEWEAFSIVVRVIGVVRSVDSKHRRVVVEPLRAIVSNAL
jgi:hypothetical protein